MSQVNRTLFLLIFSLFLETSCEHDQLPSNENIPTSKLNTLMQIKDLGFNENNIIDNGDFYLVDQDIIFYKDKDYSQEKTDTKADGRTQQYIWSRVNFENQHTISVYIDSSIPTTGKNNWRSEIAAAISEWNFGVATNVSFILTDEGSSADITIASDNNTLSGIAAATEFPSSGKPGSTILINFDWDSNAELSSDFKLNIMLHELGHAVGFYHENWKSLGERAPTEIFPYDVESFMMLWNNSSDPKFQEYRGFSKFDIYAINAIYPPAKLLAVQGKTLFLTRPELGGGGKAQLGPDDDWRGAVGIGFIGGMHAYVLQNNTLVQVEQVTGKYKIVGKTYGWKGAQSMVSMTRLPGEPLDNLYVMKKGTLYKVAPTNTTSPGISQLGKLNDWPYFEAMTGGVRGRQPDNENLFIVENGTLWRVNPDDGTYIPLGKTGDWLGTEGMAFSYGQVVSKKEECLYIVQGGVLYSVNTTTGHYTPLSEPGEWYGIDAMVSHGYNLYIAQGGILYEVDPDTGAYKIVQGDWSSTYAMAAYW